MTKLRTYSYDYMPYKWSVQSYHDNIFCRYTDYVHGHNQ